MPLNLPAVMDPHFEAALRQRCLSALDGLPTAEETQPGPDDLMELLRTGTHLLELLVIVSATAEVVAELQIQTYGDVRRRADDIQRRVASATGLDVLGALQFAREVGLPRGERPPEDAPVRVGMQRLARHVRSVTASCPTDVFDELAAILALPELGYRFQVACESLRAFLRRHDPQQRELVLVVGRHYQRGTMELGEVAKLLGETPADTIALLEEHGFGRTLDTIALPEGQRSALLARIRRDRLERGGTPAYSREMVRRSTIASERIEGVDARPWLGAEGVRDRGR